MSEYTIHIGMSEIEEVPEGHCGACGSPLKPGRQTFQVIPDPETGIGAEDDGLIVCRTCSWEFVNVRQVSGSPEKHREHYDDEAQQALKCHECGTPLIAQVALVDGANTFCRACAKAKEQED